MEGQSEGIGGGRRDGLRRQTYATRPAPIEARPSTVAAELMRRFAGTIDPRKVVALKAEGLDATEIAAKLGVGRASVYRMLDKSAPAA